MLFTWGHTSRDLVAVDCVNRHKALRARYHMFSVVFRFVRSVLILLVSLRFVSRVVSCCFAAMLFVCRIVYVWCVSSFCRFLFLRARARNNTSLSLWIWLCASSLLLGAF